jgi:hypothetical protein
MCEQKAFDVQNCLLGCTAGMMEAVRTSETSVDNHFTRQYIPEDNSEHHTRHRENLKSSQKALVTVHRPSFYIRYTFTRLLLVVA